MFGSLRICCGLMVNYDIGREDVHGLREGCNITY